MAYDIEKGLKTVEREYLPSAEAKKAQIIAKNIQNWRRLLGLSIDEGRIIGYIALDNYGRQEALMDNSPLNELRSIDQYYCWNALERFLQDSYGRRFFDLCK